MEGAVSGRRAGRLWRDKKKFADINKAGFSFSTSGIYPQSPWGYLTSNFAGQDLAYNGIFLVAASNYALSDSATLGTHSFEYFGRCLSETSADQNYLDAHIKDVIADFLTNAHYGAISSATSAIPLQTAAMHDYCVARGLLISPVIDQQQEAQVYLTEWARVANAGIVWSDGHLKFVPYADLDFSGSFGSYTADTTIRATLDDDNQSTPVVPTRKKPADCFNEFTVEVLSRGFDYNVHPCPASDQSSIENDGLRPNTETLTLNSVCLPRVGMIVARTELNKGLYIRNSYTAQTSLDYDFLEPMDYVYLTDAGLGLDSLRCRVTQIDDTNDGLTIIMDECPWGVSCG
jgi:hypothetical protein